MKVRFLTVLAVAVSVLGIFLSTNVQTAECKCAIANFQTELQQSKAVFAGRIVSEEKRGDVRIFKVRAEKYWKGSRSKTVEVSVYENARYQAWFKKDKKYLIYATADENGKLFVGRCSRSMEIGDAKEDLRKLGKGKIPR